jgi:hypothetical protein
MSVCAHTCASLASSAAAVARAASASSNATHHTRHSILLITVPAHLLIQQHAQQPTTPSTVFSHCQPVRDVNTNSYTHESSPDQRVVEHLSVHQQHVVTEHAVSINRQVDLYYLCDALLFLVYQCIASSLHTPAPPPHQPLLCEQVSTSAAANVDVNVYTNK